MTQRWTLANIPDQAGRVVVVTGANSGTGFAASQALAAKGATVIMACRNSSKGQEAVDQIRSEQPDARIELRSLDLADLASVRGFAQSFNESHKRLDLLLNNAGIMGLHMPRPAMASNFSSGPITSVTSYSRPRCWVFSRPRRGSTWLR